MASQILRPTTTKRQKGKWLVQGAWGKRSFDSADRSEFYRQLYDELIENGRLPADSPPPSSRRHYHITSCIMTSSWIVEHWVPDESFATRLKWLRIRASLTQSHLADNSGLDLGTIRHLEQGTRTNPQWQTVCALARGLQQDVAVFVGTDGHQPPMSPRSLKT